MKKNLGILSKGKIFARKFFFFLSVDELIYNTGLSRKIGILGSNFIC